MIRNLKAEMEFKQSEHYDFKALLRYLLISVTVIVFWKINSRLSAVSVSLFVIFSAMKQKPIDLMFGMLFITYGLVGNRQILVSDAVSLTLMRGTLMLLTIMLMREWSQNDRKTYLIRPFWGIMVYLVWEALISFQGFSPIVSYLKLFFFISVFLALLGVASTVNHSTQTNARLLRSAILAIVSIVIIGSILLIPFPSLSLSLIAGEAGIKAMQAGEIVSLFQGMITHSQALGIVVAVMGTFVFADLTFSIKKWDKFYILLLLLSPVLIYMSSSRTGMGTLIAGMGMVVLLIMQGKGLAANWKGKLLMTINMFIIVGAIVIYTIPSVRGQTTRFALKLSGKGVGRDISLEYLISSRQKLVDESVRNFKEKPIVGNGFQVSSAMVDMKHSGFLSYLSSPVEKGVWICAVPEEGGIIGMALFCIWIIVLFKLLVAHQAYIGSSVFFAFLMANFGEFTLFSMSYIGGICWALTFAALCLDVQRLRSTDTMEFMNTSLRRV